MLQFKWISWVNAVLRAWEAPLTVELVVNQISYGQQTVPKVENHLLYFLPQRRMEQFRFRGLLRSICELRSYAGEYKAQSTKYFSLRNALCFQKNCPNAC